MSLRQDPPTDLRAAARRAGILSVVGVWYRQDDLSDPREFAGVRCHCRSGGRLVLLAQVEAASGCYRVGQCPGCHAVVWSPCQESLVYR